LDALHNSEFNNKIARHDVGLCRYVALQK